MKQIIERLNDLQEIILEPDFTNKKGLGGEIGFYIFDYDAADELIVRHLSPGGSADLLAVTWFLSGFPAGELFLH